MIKLKVPIDNQPLQEDINIPTDNTYSETTASNQNNTSNVSMPGAILEAFDKGKKKKAPPEYDFVSEMKKYGNALMYYDGNKPLSRLIKEATVFTGIKPSLLYSSAWIEGMNKLAAAKPNEDPEQRTENWYDLWEKDKSWAAYPIDGYSSYGLDTFGNKYNDLKKYLPVGFESKFRTFDIVNELGQDVKTAAFKTNKDALIAKAAMLKYEEDNVLNYAKKMGIELDEDAKDYFVMASYNSGFGNGRKMLDEYKNAVDKKRFIDNGETRLKAVHKNVSRRMKLRQTANSFYN